ncbi:probable serine/threonine-protein kinase DDB_G0282963 [Chrysoperla carnea]|uniref:probable serine/threonine-protein kinase DDB_G0282963 n=1 Tax=Chrysoperla carnea TaxID=189513 RepID=UPI001D079138|nr:probable serine/threonine-protein kinase DDB_G0282963 [Chrysoperla carnea]
MSSELCDGVRGALPPIPALIPITVLRPCGGTTQQSSSTSSSPCSVTDDNNTVINNNKSGGSINNNCVRNNSNSKSYSSDSQNSNSSDNIVNNTTTQQRSSSSFGYSVVRGGAAVVSATTASEHSSGGGGGRQQRTRRSTQQTVHNSTIDPSVQSRDRCSSEQAPTRRSSRPERHRKSDRRRCGHRTDRQKCTTTCSRSHSSVQRKITNRATDKSDTQPTTTVPRVNPIFLWVKQEDTRIVEVRCEDYDKRNRIRLTKTAQGWRAIPRTETLLPASVTPVLSDPKPIESIDTKQNTKQSKKTKNRKSSKSKRKSFERLSGDGVGVVVDDSNNTQVKPNNIVDPEIEALTVTREETSSPAWSAPVNIESHLPSHTITIPRKKLLLDGPDSKAVVVEEPTAVTTTTTTTSVGDGSGVLVVGGNNNTDETSNSSSSSSNNNNNNNNNNDVARSEENKCCVNSADCSAPPPLLSSSSLQTAPIIPAPPQPSLDPNTVGSCDVTPLDNLLAVAEFEFNHQVHSENEQKQLHQEDNNTIIELDSSSDDVGDDNDDLDQEQQLIQSSQVNDNHDNLNDNDDEINEIIDEDYTDNIDDKHDDNDNEIDTNHCFNENNINDNAQDNDNDDDEVTVVETTDNIETLADLSEQHKEFFENIVQLNKLIESRTAENLTKISIEQSKETVTNNITTSEPRQSTSSSDECGDYNEDDENNLAMDDIITRLEQSLQSPEEMTTTTQTPTTTCCTTADMEQLCADATNFIPITNDDETSEKIEEINDKSNNNNTDVVVGIGDEEDEDDDVTYINEEENEIKNETIKHGEENQCDIEEVEDEDDDVIVAVEDDHCNTPPPATKDDIGSITQDNKITSLEILDSTTTAFDEKSTVESIIDDDVDEEVDEQPTDLSITKNSTINLVSNVQDEDFEDDEDVEFEENTEEDLPTDLSIPKHIIPTPPPLRVETPRPPSHSSETIQSPQPSGIPAVPPSPDIFFSNSTQKNKSLFLETLLSSSSPKLCLTPEVTITRQQKEPLDLGKSRKSASPTVTCSEEVKNDNNFKFNNNDGEPNAKRLKIEDITLKNLLHKTKGDAKITKEKSDSTNEKDSSRLLHLLTTDTDVDPVIQFKQLLADDINIPDPLLVPKNRLNQILMAPGVEIPRLLTERPELRLPDALAFPQLLQNPDILVISIAQLQIILQKHSETIKLHETATPPVSSKPEKVKPTPPVVKKSVEVQEKPTHTPSSTDFVSQYAAAKSAAALLPPHISAAGLFDSNLKPTSLSKSTKDNPNRLTTSGLAGDIDAATTAAFNQMLWLPYLNQLEAAAMACGNNTDFLKALNAVFPPTLPPFDPAQMFPNFGMHNNFPPAASMDYNNQLEMAMWQEAMMKANMAASAATPNTPSTPSTPSQSNSRSKNAIDSSYPMSKSFYRENTSNNHTSSSNNSSSNNLYNMEGRNSHLLTSKKSNQNIQPNKSTSSHHHTSARTSPITHNFNQQRFPSNTAGGDTPASMVPTNPYLNNLSNAYPFNHNLQIPHYNPNLAQWNGATAATAAATSAKQQHSSRSSNKSASSLSKSSPSVPNYQNFNNLMTSKSDYLKYQQNILNAYNQRNKQDERTVQSKPKPSESANMSQQQPQQKPRVTCKSLQNLLSPSRLSQDLSAKKSSSHNEVTSIRNTLPSSTSITRLTTQPMDLSGGHPMLHSSSGGHNHHHQQSSHHHHHSSSSSSGSKLKVKQHLVDNSRQPKLLKHDEIPEVGSTTSSLEEMSTTQLQDAQNQLWHPLFGNQKSYTSPWRWTTVTVNGE